MLCTSQAPEPLSCNPALEKAANDAPEQLIHPVEAIGPASADDEHTLCMSEVLAKQLSQLPPDTEPCGTRSDCQGLKLLSRDRALHWESLVRCLRSLGPPASSAAGSHFLEQAALADCKAQAVPGTMLGLCWFLAYCSVYPYIAYCCHVCLGA